MQLIIRSTFSQDMAHFIDNLHPDIEAQIDLGELRCQVQKLFPCIAQKRSTIFLMLSLICSFQDVQALFDPIHGSIVVVGDRSIVDARIDHCGIEAFVPEELLDRRHAAARVQELRRTGVTQPMGGTP